MRLSALPLGALLLSVSAFVSCGGGGGDTPKAKLPVSITLSPHALTLTAGASFDFSFGIVIPGGNAQTDFGYAWSCTAGSVSQAGQLQPPYEDGGRYTAPAVPGTYAVTITSQYDTSKKDTAQVTVVAAPAIASFTADATDLDALDPKAVVTPVFSGGTGAITPDVGAVTSGTPLTVRPPANRTYTLTVTNAAGATTSRTLDLKVWAAPTLSLSAGAGTITEGETGILAWTVTGATSAALNPGPGTLLAGQWASGSWTISPAADTTYTLAASNPVHASSASVSVKVVAAPAITAFSVAPEVIHPGERAWATAAWTGGAGSITPSAGTFTTGVPVELGPAASTAYTLTVTNTLNRTATATRTVRVATPGLFSQPGNLAAPRLNPLLAALPGGKVLVAGGGSQGSRTPLATAEIFDPATGTSRALAATLATGRLATCPGACAMPLASGAVLVMPTSLDGVPEVFEPATETFRVLRVAPAANTFIDPAQALALPDGRILFGFMNHVAAFDPATETFTDTPLLRNRLGYALTLLGDNTVLVSGGDLSSSTGSCERLDPATGHLTLLAGTWGLRRYHRAFLGSDGRVQIWGGLGTNAYGNYGVIQQVASVDPADGSGTTTGMPSLDLAYQGPCAIHRLPDGRTLMLKTRSGTLFDPASQATLPAENEAVLWHHGTAGPDVYPYAVATLALADGRILVAGGEAECARAVIAFDPAGAYASPYSSLRTADLPVTCDFTALADGRFLVLDALGRRAPRLLGSATGVPTPTGELAQRASNLTVAAAPDGTALAFGGSSYAENGSLSATLDLVQRFSGTAWSLAGRLLTPRIAPQVVRLEDGRCVVFGGLPSQTGIWAECFDPATGTSKALPAPPRAFSSWFAAGLVKGGQVLVAASGYASLFDPATFTWNPASIPTDAAVPARVQGLPGGGAVILREVSSQTVDLSTRTCASLPLALDYLPQAICLEDGRILAYGWLQYGYNDYRDGMVLLDPVLGTCRQVPMAHGAVKGMALLSGGRVFLAHVGSSEILDLAGW